MQGWGGFSDDDRRASALIRLFVRSGASRRDPRGMQRPLLNSGWVQLLVQFALQVANVEDHAPLAPHFHRIGHAPVAYATSPSATITSRASSSSDEIAGRQRQREHEEEAGEVELEAFIVSPHPPVSVPPSVRHRDKKIFAGD